MTELPYLFISHASTDTEYTDYLVNRLRAIGYRLWVDADSVPPGTAWVRAIEDGISRCSALIVILSAAARASEWVEREVLLAYELRKPVFVTLFEDVPLPIWAINRQYSDFRRRREAGLNKLLA
ncbi:MAG: toll/interleukin-1 receptor domain-containing protein, partial [Anaerolinea sp.]|nr:toll/interleukin-1 receptor domain-containing protein [Anaerolinea sp.]